MRVCGWHKRALPVVILATVYGAHARAAPPGRRAGHRSSRVDAPTLSDNRLPPLTWSDLADPSPLTPDEEDLPLVRALAHRFNPAMAFPTRDVWPVPVSYAWHDGAPLMARV